LSQDQIEAGYRLACAAFPREELGIQVFETGEQDFSTVNVFAQDHETPCIREEVLVGLEKNAQSYARQLTPDRPLSYGELRETSKLADAQGRIFADPASPPPQAGGGEASFAAPLESGKCYLYREQGKILHISYKPEPVYAVAVDIGTTTLAMALLDLQTGKIVGRFSAVNRQREFGGDVISRIQRANEGDLGRLSQSVRNQIAEGIAALCQETAAEVQAIRKIAIVGNTTMLHLLLQLSCCTLGQTPFTPVTLDMVSLGSREIFEGGLSCETVILPGISTYVGADITAGLLFTEIHTKTDPVVFMDIGTNGEMALAYHGKILCTATAAGPAFEGGNIRWGTGSVPGAISQVQCRDGTFACTTIGNRQPVGICGSGVVDIVYQGLKADFIQSSGRFNTKLLPSDAIFLAKTEDNRDIVFCQKDVREVQLGKSAIRSGLEALLNHAGLGYGDIKTLYLAGGFGFNLNLESGIGIGLIPDALGPKISLIGNSALGGAVKFLLNPDNEKKLYQLIGQSEEFSLPQDTYFAQYFIDNINFE
jgi:uncharacterized 2Fe-2S/4Fe-4S cluster protein (DUF4445 family)